MDTSFLAFVSISILVIVTPGPDTALVIRNTIMGHRRGGVFTALGIVAGQAIWVLAASAGIVALLVASERVFLAVRLAGAAYLIYLGARSLYEAARSRAWSEAAASIAPAQRLSSRTAFGRGLRAIFPIRRWRRSLRASCRSSPPPATARSPTCWRLASCSARWP